MALTQISTAGVKDDAVTSGKIPANAVGSSELADNAVDTAAIADNAVTGAKIADSTITAAQMATNSVGGQEISANAVGTTELVDGNVTTAKLADDAVTGAKIADSTITAAHLAINSVGGQEISSNAVGSNEIADQAVTLAKLEHGTSSNDGKFLRANNGADPSFETVSIPAGTTINNNADNRVITGSGTANTLEGESQLTYDNSTNILKLASASSTSTDTNFLHIVGGGTATRGLMIGTGRSTGASQNHAMCFYDAINEESNEYGSQHIFRRGGHNNMVIGYQSNNYVGINNDYPDYELSVKATDSNESTIQILAGGNGKESNLLFGAPDDADVGAIKYDHNGDQMKVIVGGSEKFRVNSNGICIGGTGSANALDDYEEGTFTPKLRTIGSSQGEQLGAGRYTKIGNMVYLDVQFDNKNATGLQDNNYIYISNLPYVTNSRSQSSSPQTYNVNGYSDEQVYFMTDPGNAALIGFRTRWNTTWTYWESGYFRGSQIYVRVNIWYKTNS